MAERILRSPGVTTRELDLSAPGRVRPQGIPAGVIGTAQKGPAFVPVNFATLNDFTNLFGETEGKHFGAMAVREWMSNARSGVYLRVLGIGDGKKADSDGVVNNAGFRVGLQMRDKDDSIVENDGSAHKPKANPHAGAAVDNTITLTTVAGELSKSERPEVATIEVGVDQGVGNEYNLGALAGGVNVITDFDGHYIVVENHLGAVTGVLWLDAQGTRTVEAGTGKILDGVLAVADLSAITTDETLIHVLNISGEGNTHDLASAIQVRLDGGDFPSITCAVTDNGLTITQGTGGAGSQSLVTDVTTIAARAHNGLATGVASTVLVLAADTKGITGVTGSATSFSLALDPAVQVPDGTTIVINGQSGGRKIGVQINANGTSVAELTADAVASLAAGESYIAVNLNGIAIGADTADAIGGGLDTAFQALYGENASFGEDWAGAIDGVENASDANYMNVGGSVVSSAANPLALTFGIADGDSDALHTLTLNENSPNAPAGSVFFLGVQSHAPTGADVNSVTHYNDYLGASSDVVTPNTPDGYSYLLRGVLMFPSGVLPGINPSGTAFNTGDLPGGAFGSYGTGKDLGAPDHKGNVSSDGDFEIALNGFSNTGKYDAILKASFDTTSPIYFSKVFNTDPTMIQEKGHYLYASYDVPNGLAQWREDADAAVLKRGNLQIEDWTGTTHQGSDYTPLFEDWSARFSHSYSPWIMSQELGNAPKKLFRFWALDAGASGWDKFKISIANISKSTDLSSDYGSFDVQVRAANDTDLDPQILQQFRAVNLNPASDRYIARVIGDQNTFFEFDKDLGKQKLVTEGLYPNSSQYVRVEVNDQIESGMMEATALPIGFSGKNHLVLDGKTLAPDQDDATAFVDIIEPPVPFRENVSIGSDKTKVVDARFYWGIQNQEISNKAKKNQSTSVTSLLSSLTKWYPSLGSNKAWVGDNKGAVDATSGATLDADVYNNNYFSLEKLWVKCIGGNVNNAVDPTQWHEAVYIRDGNTLGEVYDSSSVNWEDADGNAKTAGYRYLDVSKDFSSQASKKFYKFTVPMQGGWDGLDIFDQDKAEMTSLSSFREMDSNAPSDQGPDGSTTAAFRKALDILSEKSDVDIQLLATPGMRTAGITDYAIDKTEDRFDALYIMDMPAYDHGNVLVTKASQETSVNYTAQNLSDRNLDTSFAATYFPDLVIADGANNVVAPPSVAVLGALSLNDKVAHPWYAPAGFARGALASTIETAVKLNRTNMDVLYESDINPITSFPQTGESVIVFGQKTMLQAQSALDRVNVRRLLIDVRRKVRTVANQILFEPNREATLARFSSLVNPILGRIQQQQGLDRYKVVIDTTTTTQQDVENNTIRGKIFLQPTRSIEFISLDFVVTNAGAEI